MEVNIGSLVYLFFRLAPFLIVSYFTLSSIFNQDFRGFVYLVGLLIACVLCIMIGKVMPNPWDGKSPDVISKCSALTLGKSQPLSNLPLSQTVFGYTLAYLSYFIKINSVQKNNISFFIFMSIVIVADLIWNAQTSCNDYKYLGLALLLGGAVGVGWAAFIEMQAPKVAYISGSDQDTCTKPSKALYRCRRNKQTDNKA